MRGQQALGQFADAGLVRVAPVLVDQAVETRGRGERVQHDLATSAPPRLS